VVVCCVAVGSVTVVWRVVVVVVVAAGSLAHELRSAATRREKNGIRSFFIV
jgi:hypothetical protein